MTRFLKKALADVRSNRFMNFITIITISLSILVVAVFMLFFENASRIMEAWNQDGRAMIYLDKGFTPDKLPELESRIRALGRIKSLTFIPKSEALENLKKEMASHTSFFDTLKGNPLPHTIEIRMIPTDNIKDVMTLAEEINSLDGVEQVECGQGWLGRFLKVFNLFKIIGYTMCSLFLLIALFITANTVRLAFHSRELEVEIMRLVGATENFIKTPFYVEGAVQGFLGGALGLTLLLGAYLNVSSAIAGNLGAHVPVEIRFLSVKAMVMLIVSSTFLGWFGCYLSLKQILK